MNNISFTDIYYPIMTDPRYKMLCALALPIRAMMHHAKRIKNREDEYAWQHMHDAYNELKGMVHAFRAIGMLDTDDMFRIPFIAYKTALKIACK